MPEQYVSREYQTGTGEHPCLKVHDLTYLSISEQSI